MNPLLPPDRPDWRWARVADLSRYSRTAALARLQQEDELTREAYDFRQAQDRGLVSNEFSDFDAAYDFYTNRNDLRLQIEGLLIGGADNDFIAHTVFTAPHVIQIYHDLFFWVRPGLDRSAWLNSVVFGGLPQMNAHMGDIRGIALRLARKLGYEGFHAVLSAGLMPEMTIKQLHSLVSEVLLTQVAMISFTAGTARELPEWAGRLLDNVDGKGGDKSESELSRAVDDFLDGLSISVADPTDKRNLELPAEEERAQKYEVAT